MKNHITLKLHSALRKMLCSNYKLFAENLDRKLFMAITLAILLCSFNRVNAQTPTFNYFISNDHMVSPLIYEFDVSIQNTSANGTAADSLKFRTAQHCFTFNAAFINGATITAFYLRLWILNPPLQKGMAGFLLPVVKNENKKSYA